jgi:hypothetical protein
MLFLCLVNYLRAPAKKALAALFQAQAQQAQMAQLAIRNLAGLKSQDEMAQLAASDPAKWVEETQRQTAISGVLAQLDHGVNEEIEKQKLSAKQQFAEACKATWVELRKDGIDEKKLKGIFDVMHSHYKVPHERLQNVSDASLVRIMLDASEMVALREKTAEVTKKADSAPRIPAQRQAPTRNEQAAKRLEARFNKGNAKIDDLAAFLQMNKI